MKTTNTAKTVEFSPHMPWRSRAFRWLLTLARTLLFDVQIQGKENIPTSNCIVVANHLSWIDATPSTRP